MTPTMLVRELSAAERQALRRGLKSADGFTVRRCQVLLASADGAGPAAAGGAVGLTAQAARNAIRAFHAEGVGCLARKPPVAKTPAAVWDRGHDGDVKDLLHLSPRTLGKPTGLWTLALVAEVCHARGWTARRLSAEGVRSVLERLGIGWKRAKHGITSPDPGYAKKKRRGTG
jgi:hypothetical protein